MMETFRRRAERGGAAPAGKPGGPPPANGHPVWWCAEQGLVTVGRVGGADVSSKENTTLQVTQMTSQQ